MGVYDETRKVHLIRFNITQVISEKIDGKYQIKLYLKDPNAQGVSTKTIDPVELDFIGGAKGDNRLGRSDFRIYDKIINIFEPEQPKKSPIIPLVASAGVIVIFFWFFGQLYTIGANLNSFSFWGLLFSLNYFAVLMVIVAFWIEINLVNTLWIMLALSPVTLFTMNQGLTADNCHISSYMKPKTKRD